MGTGGAAVPQHHTQAAPGGNSSSDLPPNAFWYYRISLTFNKKAVVARNRTAAQIAI